MGGLVRVDGLDETGACALCACLAVDFTTRTGLAAAGFSVLIETGSSPMSDLLHRLEEWTTASGLPSICVNLDGRAYILEAAGPRVTCQDELLGAAGF